jgi:type IX secretion system PorP/SprF family membrane protein
MKILKRILPVLVFICIIAPPAHTQISPVTDQYMLNPVLINPANAGARGAISVAAFYRKQWAGIKGAPETLTLVADGPFESGKVGLGVYLAADKTGVTKETSFSTLYSYRISAGENTISFGLRAGLLSTNTRWSDLIVLDPGDEFYLADTKTYIVPDFSFGAHITDDRYFAGFSIPRLLGYRFLPERNRYSVRVNPGQYYYVFHGGYLVNLAADVEFLPSALISLSPGEKMLMDLNVHFIFAGRMWTGLSYRTNKSMAGIFQFGVSNQLKVAYSHYLDFGMLGRFSNGSHEVMLRYEFLYKVDVVSPLIF